MGVIDEVDTRLIQWAGTVVPSGAEVSLDPPKNANQGSGVSLFLMELAAQPPFRGGEGRTPVQLALRYLVTVWADGPGAEHALLGDLVLDAMQQEGFCVELAAPAPEAWAALGASPRPSFALRVPVRHPRPEPAAKRVRRPLVVQRGELTHLAGVVLGPGDVPVAGARVEIPSAEVATETDWLGRFTFPGLPLEPPQRLARVRARGREIEVEITRTEQEEPVVIRVDQLLED